MIGEFEIRCGSQTGQRDMLTGATAYGVIYADPPWRYETRSDAGRDKCPDGASEKLAAPAPLLEGYGEAVATNFSPRLYPTMPTDEIAALPVGQYAARDCVLFMWCSSPQLLDALRVGAAWGFTFKTVAFVWVKTVTLESLARVALDIAAKLAAGVGFNPDWLLRFTPIGPGHWTRANPELCLLFTRGNPSRKDKGVRELIFAPVREHSRKPDQARQSIERLVAGPYLELFARTAPANWDVWGNQTDKFTQENAT